MSPLSFWILLSILKVCISIQLNCDSTNCFEGYCEEGLCVCYPGWGGSRCQHCDGRYLLNSTSGIIHDGVGSYEVDSKCTWIVDNAYSKPLRLSFKFFETECGWDHLYVFDGNSLYSPLVGSFSGGSLSIPDITLNSGKAFIYFFSDVAYQMQGFELSYRVLICPEACSGNGICNESSETCSCLDGWSGVACNISTTETLCKNNCTDEQHGLCLDGVCHCNIGYIGDDCSTDSNNIVLWTTEETTDPPKGRASFGADVLGRYYYICSGETLIERFVLDRNYTSHFYRQDLETGTWETLPDYDNKTRHSLTLTAHAGSQQLFMYGGKVSGKSTASLAGYNVSTQSWTVLNSGIYDVFGHTAHIVNDVLYVFFGQSSIYGYASVIQTYNIKSGEWAILNTTGVLVKGRYGHVSVYDNTTNSTFVYAGYHDGSADNTYQISKYLYKLNMANSKWEMLIQSKYQSYLNAAAYWRGYMVTTGGNANNGSTSSATTPNCHSDVISLYDICCDRWYELPAVDNSLSHISRHGHHMFTYNNSVYIFGGYNGMMLNDIVKLQPAKCDIQLSAEACAAANLLTPMIIGDQNKSLCSWSVGQGCQDISGSCDKTQCTSSSEGLSMCNSFSDCISCQATEGCYYYQGRCSNIKPSYGESKCTTSTCLRYENCQLCNSFDGCVWSRINKQCTSRSNFTQSNSTLTPQCDEPCSSYTSCTNCTSNKCLWCGSQEACVDTISYLSSFPYGQCLEWATDKNKCKNLECDTLTNCDDCQRNPMCGWCNDPSNTGKGKCMKGTKSLDLEATCPVESWFYTECPACQCNGHSTCNSLDECINCSHNTTGSNCETCMDGLFGDPSNGGSCQRCMCDGVADTCDPITGVCKCWVQGAKGDKCDECDSSRSYFPETEHYNQCYYNLSIDFRYTFNFSKSEDQYVSTINLQCVPKYEERDIELTIVCYGPTYINLTFYSVQDQYKLIKDAYRCYDETMTLSFSYKDYTFRDGTNATFLLKLYSFQTPFIFKVSFTQYSRINLLTFFFVFFGCFITLLLIAGVVWKIRIRYALMRRQQAERLVRRNMASRPFASLLLYNSDLKAARDADNTKQSISSEPTGHFHRSGGSKRYKNKNIPFTTQHMVTPIGVELLNGHKSGVISVIVKLPTGDEEVPGYGQSGLAVGSALISMNPHNSNYATKVGYKQGKVTFKSPSLFNPA